MPAHEEAHDDHKLSIKLKVVIMLLVFGFLMLLADAWQDKSLEGVKKKKSKKKNQASVHL